jgi:hypothetical protein
MPTSSLSTAKRHTPANEICWENELLFIKKKRKKEKL